MLCLTLLFFFVFALIMLNVPVGSIFNKLIDEQGHLDMRNVTTLIWVNRKRFDIVETIVELLIEVIHRILYETPRVASAEPRSRSIRVFYRRMSGTHADPCKEFIWAAYDSCILLLLYGRFPVRNVTFRWRRLVVALVALNGSPTPESTNTPLV